MANLLCPICGKLFYGIDIGKPCQHVRKKPDGTYEFAPLYSGEIDNDNRRTGEHLHMPSSRGDGTPNNPGNISAKCPGCGCAKVCECQKLYDRWLLSKPDLGSTIDDIAHAAFMAGLHSQSDGGAEP